MTQFSNLLDSKEDLPFMSDEFSSHRFTIKTIIMTIAPLLLPGITPWKPSIEAGIAAGIAVLLLLMKVAFSIFGIISIIYIHSSYMYIKRIAVNDIVKLEEEHKRSQRAAQMRKKAQIFKRPLRPVTHDEPWFKNVSLKRARGNSRFYK